MEKERGMVTNRIIAVVLMILDLITSALILIHSSETYTDKVLSIFFINVFYAIAIKFLIEKD